MLLITTVYLLAWLITTVYLLALLILLVRNTLPANNDHLLPYLNTSYLCIIP